MTINAPEFVPVELIKSVIAALLTRNSPPSPPESLVPPISIVLPLTYNDLNLRSGLPRSYVFDTLGYISPTKVDVLPTYKLPPIPTPPAIINAPVVVEVELVVLIIVIGLLVELPLSVITCSVGESFHIKS